MTKIFMTIARDKIVVNTEPKDIDGKLIAAAFSLAGQTLLEFVGVETPILPEKIWDDFIPNGDDFELIITVKDIGAQIDSN